MKIYCDILKDREWDPRENERESKRKRKERARERKREDSGYHRWDVIMLSLEMIVMFISAFFIHGGVRQLTHLKA